MCGPRQVKVRLDYIFSDGKPRRSGYSTVAEGESLGGFSLKWLGPPPAQPEYLIAPNVSPNLDDPGRNAARTERCTR